MYTSNLSSVSTGKRQTKSSDFVFTADLSVEQSRKCVFYAVWNVLPYTIILH